MKSFFKVFLLLILTLSSMIHAEEKNRFKRIVARYPHLSVFLASAAGAAIGIQIYKKFDKPALAQDNRAKKSLFQSQAHLKGAAVAGVAVGTVIAAVADCGMPCCAAFMNNRPVEYG